MKLPRNQLEAEVGCSHCISDMRFLVASDFSIPKSAPRFEDSQCFIRNKLFNFLLGKDIIRW